MSFSDCEWINPPQRWSLDGGSVLVVTDDATDFWRETHYGFTRDSGHFFGVRVAEPFTAQLRVSAKYEALYDQADIMVRIDDRHWVKATFWTVSHKDAVQDNHPRCRRPGIIAVPIRANHSRRLSEALRGADLTTRAIG